MKYYIGQIFWGICDCRNLLISQKRIPCDIYAFGFERKKKMKISITLYTLHRQFCRFLLGRIDGGDRIDVGGDTIDGRLKLSFAYAFLYKNV